MSLPNYLAKIKSSGVYRFVWDKSQVPPQQAETLRLVVGYSEKGPFNTPVYVETAEDFIQIYGNISKRLERKGVYFHRLAIQALQAGPILAFNTKLFGDENIEYVNFNPADITNLGTGENSTAAVSDVFDTTRFWALDSDKMVENIDGLNKYVTIAATDSLNNSCSLFIRKQKPESYKGITLRTWFASQGVEVPEYAETILDSNLDEYFAEVYVFRGEFTNELIGANGVLGKYFENGAIKSDYTNVFGPADALDAMTADSNSNFVGIYSGIMLPNFKDANNNYISLDIKFNADNNKHKMLMKLDESKLESLSGSGLSNILKVANVTDVKPVYIQGYEYKKSAGKAGQDLYDDCMEVIKTKGIREALTNRVDVEYHYLIDTFDSEISNTKAELFKLAQEKDNAFAIVNFPKMSKFGISSDNSIKDAIDGFKVNMPSESEGASYGAYYTQLVFSDGTVKSVIPSAALVSNLFMEKWSSRQPYYIVAGPSYGRLSYSGLVGPDFNFGRADLDVLEPAGINAIIYVPRRGVYINSNQTAKQVPVSGLSKIHIRELIIFLQNEVESLLQSYQWELNTQSLRDTIKAKADAICETIKNNGGVYAYVNICNETNNTAEVIDNEMIILDTEIEPARGAGKMVHQLTIHKTGGLTSSVR